MDWVILTKCGGIVQKWCHPRRRTGDISCSWSELQRGNSFSSGVVKFFVLVSWLLRSSRRFHLNVRGLRVIRQNCRSCRPSLGLDTVCAIPFLVITTVAGCHHLYGSLWLLRALVIIFIWRHMARVYWERSAYTCIPVYGAGSSGADLAFASSFSFVGKKWIFISTSLGIDASRCLGFGMRCIRSMIRSIGDTSGSS